MARKDSPAMVQVAIRLTEDQHVTIQAAAEAAGYLSLAEFIRTTVWREALRLVERPVPAAATRRDE